MEQANAGSTSHHDYYLQRLIVLTDAVFAIAMTLTALQLRPPETWDGTVVGLFTAMRGSLLAYAVSFFVVAAYWSSHRRSFASIVKADGLLTLLTLLALGLVTLLPVVTSFVTDHQGKRAAVTIYLGLFVAIGVADTLAWAYACLRPGLIDPVVGPHYRLFRLLTLLLLPLASCAATFVAVARGESWPWVFVLALIVAVAAIRRWAKRADRAPAKPEPQPPAPAA